MYQAIVVHKKEKIMHQFDILGLYMLILLFLELVSLIVIKFRKVYLFIAVLLISLLSALFFRIDWDFVGENKDSIITGKLFFLIIGITNLISLIMILISTGFRYLRKRMKNKNAIQQCV